MDSLRNTLPARDGRPPFGAQVEALLALWRASVLPLLPFSLIYLLGGLLPWLTMAPLRAATLMLASETALAAATPFATSPDPDALARAFRAWATAPSTWGLFVLYILVWVFAVTAMLSRQHDLARGNARGFGTTFMTALARLPSALAAWLAYVLVSVLALLPVAAALTAFVWFALQAESLDAVLALMALFLVGSLLSSVPLVWASVAFGFAPVLATIEGGGPVATMRRSARQVRGRWVRVATLMTLAWLVYFGLAGAVSSLAMLIAAGVAYAAGGIAALFAGQWLGWAQLAAVVPTALLVPMAFAGMIVAWRDAQDLNGFQPSSE